MPNPFFMTSYMMPRYVDNYWLKDQTFYSDSKLLFENAAYRSANSDLYSWDYNFSSMPNFYMGAGDLGTPSFSDMFNRAIEKANMQFQSMMTSMQGMFAGSQAGAFQPVAGGSQVGQVGGSQNVSEPKMAEGEDKAKWDTAKKDCEKLIKEYAKLDSDTIEKLGLEKAISNLKEDYSAATKVDELNSCIDTFKKVIESISEDSLKKILTTGTFAHEISTFKSSEVQFSYAATAIDKVLNSIEGKPVVDKDTIMAEIYTRLNIGAKCLLEDVIADFNHGKEDKTNYTNVIETLSNYLLEYAAGFSTVAMYRTNLINARKDYVTACADKNNNLTTQTKTAENLIKSYKALFMALLVEEANKNDGENKDKINKLPELIKSRYYDEHSILKDCFAINLRKVEHLIDNEYIIV